MECVNCGALGCSECEDKGTITLTGCPLEFITDDVWEIIQYAELYEKGLPPVAGGALDQAKVFLDTARFVFREKAYWEKKLGVT